MQEPYKYFIRLGAYRRQVVPINVRELQLSYDLNDDDRRFSFEENLTGDLVFGNEWGDFDFLLGFEQSGNKCRPVIFEIEKKRCDGQYEIWKTTVLKMVEGDWDLDNCTVSIPATVINDYTCFNENADKEVNLLSLPLPKIRVDYIRGAIEKFQYNAGTYAIDDPAQFGGVPPASIGWKCYKAIRHTQNLPPTFTFYYAREVLTLPAAQNPGPDWIMIQNMGANRKWARLPLLIFDWQNTSTNPAFGDQYILNYTVFGDGDPGSWDNGIMLADLLQFFAASYCGITVISDFFQINPQNLFSATYPAFTDGITQGHIVFQKSDVKRPNDANNATRAPFTFRKLLLGISHMHNLWWRIENGELRIEHVSYWQRNITYDTTVGEAKRRLLRTRRYTYQTEKLPRYEVFKFMEEGTADFTGLPIEYVGDCVNDSAVDGSGKKTYEADGILTDVEWCMHNADPKSSKVSDEGIVIMATAIDQADGKRYPVTVAPTLEGEKHLNNSLGWAFLHKEYHRHERLQLNGYMNGTYQNFITTKPSKKRVRVGISFCCDDVIDLNGRVMTDMGEALVGQASFLLYQDELELDLVYRDEIGNLGCLRPQKFVLHSYDAGMDAFFFETVFPVPGQYITEIEAIKPDGSKAIFPINPDENGIYPAQFLPHIPGIWRFRKRVLCDQDFYSPWSDFTSYSLGFAACNAIPQPVVYLGKGNQPSYFLFRINEPLVTPVLQIQAEVTRPGGASPYIVNQGVGTFSGNNHDITIDINAAPPYALNAPVPPGLYRFRFRRVCNAASGQYTEWTNYVDVNI